MSTVLDQQDVRLDDSQQAMMRQMMETLGITEREAKLRVMCIAAPPDHFKVIPVGFKPYPQMVYHPDGRNKLCPNAKEHEAARAAGWGDAPLQIHLDKFQGGAHTVALAFEVPGSVLKADEKKKASAARSAK